MLLLLLACATPAPETLPLGPVQPTPTAEHSPAQSSLARSLYALGPQANTARSLLWMTEMALEPPQIRVLCDKCAQAQALWSSHDAQLQGLEAKRQAALGPLLQSLEQQLLAGPLSPDAARSHAQALNALELPDPLALRSDTVRATLALAQTLWPVLNAAQQSDMGSALFLLRDLDSGTRSTPPALPEPWTDGDFSTLRRSTPSKDPSISALFELENGDPTSTLSQSDHEIMLALLLTHPGTQAACQAMTPADPL
ncbi:MAG: hypothetical protein ACI9VR_000315 [Cognaticolwellia sp.]|jgi:hypothetical protein